eukprot:5984897-Pyramimonas_sp.AAC.1
MSMLRRSEAARRLEFVAVLPWRGRSESMPTSFPIRFGWSARCGALLQYVWVASVLPRLPFRAKGRDLDRAWRGRGRLP